MCLAKPSYCSMTVGGHSACYDYADGWGCLVGAYRSGATCLACVAPKPLDNGTYLYAPCLAFNGSTTQPIISACSNAPSYNARYTGTGSAWTTLPALGATDCPWACNSGFFKVGSSCQAWTVPPVFPWTYLVNGTSTSDARLQVCTVAVAPSEAYQTAVSACASNNYDDCLLHLGELAQSTYTEYAFPTQYGCNFLCKPGLSCSPSLGYL